MGEARRRKQLLGSKYGKPSTKSRILNDASKYRLETPLWLNKWGFTDNANLDNPPLNVVAVKASMDYIDQNFYPIKTINRNNSSYGIKHLVEDSIGQYVANGELIIAMINCGYKYKQWSVSSPNCWFNVSQKSINNARKE